jgi:Ca2+-binding RTX toxin-like protein
VIGGNGNDSIVIGNASGTTNVSGGLGADTITASAGADNFHFASAAESPVSNPDQIVNFDPANDQFVFDHSGANGFTESINFIGSNAFDGTPAMHQSEARLDVTGGQTTLQIDVNGDGVMDANDIAVHLTNVLGTLHSSNFVLA